MVLIIVLAGEGLHDDCPLHTIRTRAHTGSMQGVESTSGREELMVPAV